MAALATQIVDRDGLPITFSAAAGGGDSAVCHRQSMLLVRNGDASSKDVTLATPGTVDGLAVADRTISVAAGVTTANPLDPDVYGDADGTVAITYSAVTSVTVAVVRR